MGTGNRVDVRSVTRHSRYRCGGSAETSNQSALWEQYLDLAQQAKQLQERYEKLLVMQSLVATGLYEFILDVEEQS